MNDIQENHLSRGEKVLTFITDHAADLTATPSITATLGPDLEAIIEKITTDATQSEVDITGYAATKAGYRTDLDESVIHVASGLVSYADDNDDFVLLHMVDFPRSSIEAFRNNRILSFSKIVFDKASVPAVKADLATNHNVSNADITTLDTRRTTFSDYIAQPLEKRDERSAYTKLVARDFETLQTILDKIERKMNTYFVNDRTLWDIYDAANHIDDTGSQSGNQTASGDIGAGAEQKLFDITYNADTNIVGENTGDAKLEFSIRLTGGGAPPVSTPALVEPGNTFSIKMGSLADSGNELWVQNMGTVQGSYSVEVQS